MVSSKGVLDVETSSLYWAFLGHLCCEWHTETGLSFVVDDCFDQFMLTNPSINFCFSHLLRFVVFDGLLVLKPMFKPRRHLVDAQLRVINSSRSLI